MAETEGEEKQARGGVMTWIERMMLAEGMISGPDLGLLRITDSPSEAVEIVSRSQDALTPMDATVSHDYSS